MKNKKTYRMVWSGVFLALGVILPFLTGQIQSIGNKLLPMHLPVLLCGFICGAPYGLAVGLILPILRSFLFGMPPMFPVAVSMALELGTYGLVSGLVYGRLLPGTAGGGSGEGSAAGSGSAGRRNAMIYVSLVAAMLLGRVVAGLANVVLYGIEGNAYSFPLFFTGMFLNALPGMALQLILVPLIVLVFAKSRLTQSVMDASMDRVKQGTGEAL